MIANKECQWATAMEKLKTHAARMQGSRLPPGLDQLLDQIFELGDLVLQELAGARDGFEARIVRLEREASRHAEAWTLLFDTMPVACVETHPNGIILRANTSAALLLNIGAKHLDGRLLTLFSEHRDQFNELLRTLSHGPARHRTSLAIRPRERAPFSAELLLMPSAADTPSSWLWFLGAAPQPGRLSAPRRHSRRPAEMIDLVTLVPHT